MNPIENFTRSMTSYVKSGFKNTDDTIYNERLNICHRCHRYKLGLCLECGCIIAIKARIFGEKCPLNKWPAISGEPISDNSSREIVFMNENITRIDGNCNCGQK